MEYAQLAFLDILLTQLEYVFLIVQFHVPHAQITNQQFAFLAMVEPFLATTAHVYSTLHATAILHARIVVKD